MRSSELNLAEYIRPIGILRNESVIKFAGTGFGIEKPGLVLAAAHVVSGVTNPQEIYIELPDGNPLDVRFLQAHSLHLHPTADLVALLFEPNPSLRAFKLGNPPTDMNDFYLGTEIVSYGYPSTTQSPDKVHLEPRLMTGYLQRNFYFKQFDYSFQAYELSFPVMPGQSGSPILLADDIDYAIAVLTTNFESSTLIDFYEEHHENDEKEFHKITKVINFGVGLALWPFTEWIRSL